jgi:rSAM/selenodomain-associated transferase 1
MRDTVIVFARAPRLGTIKRRLAKGVGDRAALRFHSATLTALLRDLTSCRRFNVVLAATPNRMHIRLPVRVTRVEQGHGDLGKRMSRALSGFRKGRVALMGCDIPEAGSADIHAAFRALGTADAIFGPAEDGGYWLIALGPRRPADLFGPARWSTEHALEDTLKQFRHHRTDFIRTLHDVDTATDWHCWQSAKRQSGFSMTGSGRIAPVSLWPGSCGSPLAETGGLDEQGQDGGKAERSR